MGRKRVRETKAVSVPVKRLTKEQLRIGRLLYPETDYWRPSTRDHCSEFGRPCPFVSCEHHLYLDVNPNSGSIKFNFPDLEVWEMKETCALDIADKGEQTLEAIGEAMNITRERVRQIQDAAIGKVRRFALESDSLKEYHLEVLG